jgi:hypothetical protein
MIERILPSKLQIGRETMIAKKKLKKKVTKNFGDFFLAKKKFHENA